MKKVYIIFIVLLMLFLAGCNFIPGQDFTFNEKHISDFDKIKAEQIIAGHEKKVVELSEKQTLSKDQFIKYREEIAETLGNDFGFEIANSFFDQADIENSELNELKRASIIIYPSLVDDNVYLESSEIVEHIYKDDDLSKKTYLKVSILSSDEQMNDFYRTYYFEKNGDDWRFSHIKGVLTYSYQI